MKNKYINEGSYGCVIKSGIKCKKNIKKNTVSKFFLYKKDWLNEINNYKLINSFLKDKNLLKMIDYCYTNKKNEILKKCNMFNNNKKKIIYNIIYEYGGVDLYDLIVKNNITFKDIFIKFGNILETVKILSNNNYVHLDIRLPNILYNKTNKELKLIDYGLMLYTNNIKKKFNKLKKYVLYYLPPELNNDNLNDLYKRIIKKYVLKYNYIYYKNKIKKKQIQTIIDFTFSNLKNKNINQAIDVHKIDIYMIGIVLYELIIYMNIYNNLNISDKKYYLVIKFIKKLIEPNVHKRYTIEKALDEYKKLLVFIKK